MTNERKKEMYLTIDYDNIAGGENLNPIEEPDQKLNES